MLLKKLHRWAQIMMPEGLYVAAAPLAIALLDPKRRHSGVTVAREGRFFVAKGPHATYYFDSPFKLGRYLYRDKSHSIEQQLLRKYSAGAVAIERGDVVVDIGSNIGEFTRGAAELASIVIAIDPDPSPLGCLTHNVAGLPNVRTEQVALGAQDGEATLYVSSARSDSSLVEPTQRWTHKITVPMLTLKSLMARHSLTSVDFLKVEAEGLEPEILHGAREVLHAIRKVAVDVSPERAGQSTRPECEAILREAGFETFSRDWMLFAIRQSVRIVPT